MNNTSEKKTDILDILQKPLKSYKPKLKPLHKISAHQEIQNPTDNELKERAINPHAMRPDNMNVTIKPVNKTINAMKKIFGF